MRLAPIIATVSRTGRIAFWISVVVLAGVICYNQFGKDEVPITRSIGLKADYDEVRDWFNTQTVRNLVYENKNADPQFYAGIVGKIENCEWVKSMNLEKQEPAGGFRTVRLRSDGLHGGEPARECFLQALRQRVPVRRL